MGVHIDCVLKQSVESEGFMVLAGTPFLAQKWHEGGSKSVMGLVEGVAAFALSGSGVHQNVGIMLDPSCLEVMSGVLDYDPEESLDQNPNW